MYRSRTGAAPTLNRPIWVVAAAASVGAGVIHLALGPEHVEELGALGYGFFVSAALQLGWAAVAATLAVGVPGLASRRWMTMLVASGIAINLVILVAWAVSRVVGLPAGEMPWTPEAIGISDGIVAVLEGALVLGLGLGLRGGIPVRPARRRWLASAAAVLAILVITAGTAVAISPSGEGHTHSPGHDHPAVRAGSSLS